MKLRNRKTGEIGEPRVAYQEIYVDTTEHKTYCYKTIAGLYKEWEDYELALPLIKNPKIRKAVKAWAEACNIKKAYLVTENEEGSTFYIYKFQNNCYFMQIATHDHNPIEGRRAYTITELCGEEEE